jgi:NADH:ubiquinone oxidoreductase subunit 5 (subunit L)/multisubunit Na+/H+ antiporter MnhA subunit
MKHQALWSVEIALVVLLALVLLVPIQDYAMREFKEYLRHPTPETLKAFQNKAIEESRLRHEIALPIAAVVLALAIPLYRKRDRNPKAL